MKKEKINPELLREEIKILHRASDSLNDESIKVMRVKNLSTHKTLDLNNAFRTAKRELILAQTELWNKLIEPFIEETYRIANQALVKRINKNDRRAHELSVDMNYAWKPKKKKRAKK